ncbi:MAG: OPT/YSL family transporter, partial [Coriobacteriales bacterium]|nr:OPT/YSL family transporter [Coriobacteriales bacterium]
GGALLANFGIIVGGTTIGLWDVTTAQGIVSSLGMGLMMGSGLGVVIRDILPKARTYLKGQKNQEASTDLRRSDAGLFALLVGAAALLACFGLGLGPVATVVVVALSLVTTIMSAQSVGQTGIDPMEIFGLIVLLAVAALGESSQVRLFFVAGIIAVACGLGGDVMSDFKTGQILGTNPREMWIGQAIGALLGTVVSVVVMVALVGAYGTEAFGPGQLFVSAQASVVATMVSGIPSVPAFVIGLVAGIVLYCLGLPSMMIGLGVYLPFYMSLSAPLGALAKLVYDRVAKKSTANNELSHDDTGIIVASGLLGGESIVGVCIALATVIAGLMG